MCICSSYSYLYIHLSLPNFQDPECICQGASKVKGVIYKEVIICFQQHLIARPWMVGLVYPQYSISLPHPIELSDYIILISMHLTTAWGLKWSLWMTCLPVVCFIWMFCLIILDGISSVICLSLCHLYIIIEIAIKHNRILVLLSLWFSTISFLKGGSHLWYSEILAPCCILRFLLLLSVF